MNLEEYQNKLKLSSQNNSIKEHIYEMLELFNDLADTKNSLIINMSMIIMISFSNIL